jgi:hypothetical protein
LIAENDGVLLTDLRAAMAARFETPAKALKAAKQIQESILEFARHRPERRATAAIVIVHRETEPELTEGRDSASSNAPGRSLLQYAKPTQILLTEGAYEKLREIPGLRFRPVIPAGTPSSGVVIRGQELIWGTPETPSRSREALPQATQIFSQNTEPVSVKVLPMPGSILADRDGIETAIPQSTGHGMRAEEPTDLRSPLMKWSLAAVGAVIVLAVALGMIAYHRKAVVVDHTSGSHQPPPEPANLSPEQIAPLVNSEVPESPAPRTDSVPKPKPPKKQPEKPIRNGLSDFSAQQIPSLLRKAEKDAGAGDYGKARREYNIVLQLDPNNATAKEGLRRLDLSR